MPATVYGSHRSAGRADHAAPRGGGERPLAPRRLAGAHLRSGVDDARAEDQGAIATSRPTASATSRTTPSGTAPTGFPSGSDGREGLAGDEGAAANGPIYRFRIRGDISWSTPSSPPAIGTSNTSRRTGSSTRHDVQAPLHRGHRHDPPSRRPLPAGASLALEEGKGPRLRRGLPHLRDPGEGRHRPRSAGSRPRDGRFVGGPVPGIWVSREHGVVRTPLRQKVEIARAQTSIIAELSAPVGGWNARDALAAMAPTDASRAGELVPPADLRRDPRRLERAHATGMTGNGKTLATYNKLTARRRCSAPRRAASTTCRRGVVGRSKAARTNGKHQWVNFGDGTNNYLILATAWTSRSTTTARLGPRRCATSRPSRASPRQPHRVNVFKGRLFFIEKTAFSSGISPRRGGWSAHGNSRWTAKPPRRLPHGDGTWTVDGGDGPDDRAVFVTSEGEVIVYQGTNPSSATTWAKIGSYYIGKPLGRRCLEKFGGDS
jgi:hypothetical protein